MCKQGRSWGRGGGRERENLKQTQSTEPDAGLDPTPLRLRPELKSRVGCLTD